mgnify:CR=1 FL=1
MDSNVLVRQSDAGWLVLLMDTESTLKHQRCVQGLGPIALELKARAHNVGGAHGLANGGARMAFLREEAQKIHTAQVVAKYHGFLFLGPEAETRCQRAAGMLISLILAARGVPVAEISEQRAALIKSWHGMGAMGPQYRRDCIAGRLELDPRATMPRNDAGGQPCEQRPCAFL